MKPCRILVVEDEAIVAMDISQRLKSLGYELAGRTGTGEEAVELAGKEHPDLVLMDIHLQGTMDGIDAAVTIRQQHGLPVIFLTAYSEETTLERAKQAEPYGYILKPFDDRELKSTIEIALHKHGVDRELHRMNRLYDVLSQVNQAVVRATSREELFTSVCQHLVERGGADLAWIAWVEPGLTTPRPIAAWGAPLESVPTGFGNPSRAIREGTSFTCNSCSDSNCPFPGSTTPASFGYQSCGSFPIRYQGSVCGVLNLCLQQPDFFRDRETSLLEEVVMDLSFAIDKLAGDSQRKLAEEERSRMEAQLRQAQKMEALGTLAGGIAHDFNNILAVIIGYTEFILMRAQETSQTEAELREVLAAANRARDLVQQILTFSRVSEQEKKPVQASLIVKEALKMLRASLPSTIQIDQQVYSNAIVMGDPTQIHQVIMNLCTNAAHALQDRTGTLRVTLDETFLTPDDITRYSSMAPGPYLRLAVSDTGTGIDPDIRERIFDPFFTTKEQGVGTGLGLAVVHGIVKSHGGAIDVESTLGIGSTFTVLLPILPKTAVPDIMPSTPLPRGSERILVVDDEPSLVAIVKLLLEDLGYIVECRTSSLEALELFHIRYHDAPFDLVITDMTMPQMTGIELAEQLHALQPELPILLCTGFSDKLISADVQHHGITELLIKPIKAATLAKLVRQALAREG